MKQLFFLLTIFLCSLSACSNVEQGTGQVLDNANSVIKHGEKKIWMPKEDGNNDTEEDQRY